MSSLASRVGPARHCDFTVEGNRPRVKPALASRSRWTGARVSSYGLRPVWGLRPQPPVLALVCYSDGQWKGDNALPRLRPDVEELLRLGGVLQIQVVLADDA